jgi:hypothetical protein
MGDNQALLNPLHPSVVDKMDPQFAEIYNKYQGKKPALEEPPILISHNPST